MSEGAGGTIGPSGSLPRRILKLGSLLFARFTRLLERFSPRLNDLLGESIERAYQLQRQSITTPGGSPAGK